MATYIYLLLVNFAFGLVINYFPNTTDPAGNLRSRTLNAGDVVNFRAASPGGTATYDFGTVGSSFIWNGAPGNVITVQAFPGDRIILLGTTGLF
jgi:hypothetical protein